MPGPAKASGIGAMIGPLLSLAATAMAAHSARSAGDAAADVVFRLTLMLGAAAAGAFCLSAAAFVLLERYIDQAAAWGIVGLAYCAAAATLYALDSRRRRGP